MEAAAVSVVEFLGGEPKTACCESMLSLWSASDQRSQRVNDKGGGRERGEVGAEVEESHTS